MNCYHFPTAKLATGGNRTRTSRDAIRFQQLPHVALSPLGSAHQNEASVSRTLRVTQVQLGAGYLDRRFMTAAADSAPTAAPAPAARSHSFARSPISGRRCQNPRDKSRTRPPLRGRLSAALRSVVGTTGLGRVVGLGLIFDEISSYWTASFCAVAPD